MGFRKLRGSLYVADQLTVTQAATLSSAVSVAQQLSASTSVDIGGAQIVDVNVLSTTQTVTAAGGMLSVGGASQTFTLPTSTAGTVYYLFWSSGATCPVVTADANSLFWGLPSTAGAKLSTNLVGSTGDHCIIVAQSSSQWNIMSYSSSLTSSS